MKVQHCITKPVKCHTTDPITTENMEDIARFCNGRIHEPLFVDLYGPELEVLTKDGFKYARVGDRIVQMPDGFHIVTPYEFEDRFSIIEWENGAPGSWQIGVVGR